ncbi:hypothetical protein BD289DRAFT_196058 [Coniella lustricola]|uniref:Uncharacterized protein n=1 Tax=Coniella lustricola TaxID=2025994 RepID=A0A2T3AMA3_9PEZI|nr:hypothetical protein BD289DRAFT_196058 [Coniella lustricola]
MRPTPKQQKEAAINGRQQLSQAQTPPARPLLAGWLAGIVREGAKTAKTGYDRRRARGVQKSSRVRPRRHFTTRLVYAEEVTLDRNIVSLRARKERDHGTIDSEEKKKKMKKGTPKFHAPVHFSDVSCDFSTQPSPAPPSSTVETESRGPREDEEGRFYHVPGNPHFQACFALVSTYPASRAAACQLGILLYWKSGPFFLSCCFFRCYCTHY